MGKNIQRKDAWDKVTGRAKYTDDYAATSMLEARLLTSTYAHARIVKIDTSVALALEGVKSVLTGADCPELFGPLMQDRPALAQGVVRYAGEPVALVVATDKATAEKALKLIEIEYEAKPIVLTPSESLAEGAVLLHEQAEGYKRLLTDIYPENGTNIASHYRMRKGNTEEAFKNCAFIAQERFFLPPSGHLSMELRTARAEISPDGDVLIHTASQAPYSVRKQIAEAFVIPSGKIQVQVAFVGGAYGGKAPVMLEILAYLASRSVGGKAVRLTITREQDMATPPCRIGLEADIKIGADQEGIIQAAELNYWLDCGAYTDIAPNMTKAIAVDCTGPYHIENLACDASCVYTNHTYATSYRSFSHESYTFCIERAMDILAQKCLLDPLEFRIRNAIRPGSLTPSQVKCTSSLTGDLVQCLNDIKPLSEWSGGEPILIKEDTVSAKGVACFWKTANPPTDAVSGALITFNPDGSVNLHTGAVEMGSNAKTHLSQMVAEKLKIDTNQVHAVMPVDTRTAPEHWKTVASLTQYMAGHAVVEAVDDLLEQLRNNGSLALGCPAEEIEVAHGRIFAKNNPEQFIAFEDIVQGFKSPTGESLGEPAIGRGGYMLKGLSMLDKETGKGKTGPQWTLGAQVVEVEANLKTCTYRLITASTVIDIGKAVNPESARAMIAGGMAMGISLSSREAYTYDEQGIPNSPNLRTYKLMHIGQEPDYRVGFVETPDTSAPYGVRSYSEHGIIAMPAALGNALSAAFGRQLTSFPFTPETIWRTVPEGGE